MEGKLRIAVIGTGGMGRGHIRGWSQNPRVEIVALCDLVPEKCERIKAELNLDVPVYTDFREMIEKEALDAVDVVTSNDYHSIAAVYALEKGLHVFCEKPDAINAAEAMKMKEASEKSGKVLMVMRNNRYYNNSRYLKDYVLSGKAGEIYAGRCGWIRRRGVPGRGGWFTEKAKSGGGPLIDLGVHVIDLCRYLMGNPKPVSVYGATFDKLGDRKHLKGRVAGYTSQTREGEAIFNVEDLATAMIRFDNGAVLQIEASFSLNIEKDEGCIKLFGTKAGAKLDPELTIYSEMNGYMTNVTLANSTALSFNGLFANEVNHFVECVKTGQPCRNPAVDGVTLMKILTGIYKSAETGHEVVLD